MFKVPLRNKVRENKKLKRGQEHQQRKGYKDDGSEQARQTWVRLRVHIFIPTTWFTEVPKVEGILESKERGPANAER